MRVDLILRGEEGPEEIRLEGTGASWLYTRGERARQIAVERLPDGRLSLLTEDGRQICGRVLPAQEGECRVVTARGASRVPLADPLRDRLSQSKEAQARTGEEEVRALMPGRVLEVRAAPGERVEPGSVLLVLEAMKMQNEIRAAAAGTVLRCEVSAGQAVEGGALLLVLHSGPAA